MRRTTNFCQVLAILSDRPMIAAMTRKVGRKTKLTLSPSPTPASTQTTTRKMVTGFMADLRTQGCRRPEI